MKNLSVKEFQLPNGLTLVHLHTKQDPISACHLFVPGGTSQEKEAELGLTTLRWALLLKGTARRSARELAEDIEMLGGSIGAGATHDYSEISCHAASSYFPDVLKIMADVLFHPLFKQEEVTKEKDALMAGIRAKKESIYSTASEHLNKHLYSEHTYGRPNSGTEKTVAQLTADQLHEWNNSSLTPKGSILAIATDIPFQKIKSLATELFGPLKWKTPSHLRRIVIPKTKINTKTKNILLREKFEQAYLMIGFPTEGIHAKDYLALKVLNAALGGGMSTRLFQELREKQGLAYDVGSYYASKLAGSAFVIYMGLQASNLLKAKSKIQEMIQEIQKNGIPEPELRLIKNYLRGTYLLDHQTNSQRAHYIGWWRILGKPASYDRDYIHFINKVTMESVLKATKKLFNKKPVIIEIQPKKPMSRSVKESLSVA